MKSAQDRFIELPELIVLLASCLPRNDLSRFMRTCRQLHTLCRPNFYSEVDLLLEYKTLWKYKDGLKAVARNSVLIQSLKLGMSSGSLYYDALQDALQERLLTAGTTDVEVKEPLFPSASNTINTGPTTLAQSFEPAHFVVRLRDILQCSPQLTELHLHQITTSQQSHIDHLAVTIAGIATLQTLVLTILSADDLLKNIALTMFFACPLLIRKLSINVFSLELLADLPAADTLQEQRHQQRHGPLYRLTELSMAVKQPFKLSDVLAVLEHCPELVSVNFPHIRHIASNIQVAAATIVNLCPKLRNLSLLSYNDDSFEQMMFSILKRIPKDTSESFSHEFYYEKDNNSLAETLARHFNTLRSIKLENCSSIRPEQIQSILFNCPLLEVFVNTEAFAHDLDITVGHLVAQEWASTRIVELALAVDIGFIDIPRYKDQINFSQADKEQVVLLETFYRQIGLQTTLRSLHLNVLVSADALDMESNPLRCRDYVFPGLLSLGDESDEGRWGGLEELAGLKNLEVIRGSFNAEAMMAEGYEFEERDTEWIVLHWPKLRRIEFDLPDWHYGPSTNPYIDWLRAKLPQVTIVATQNLMMDNTV
ncbi:hypothetical protein BGX24_011748 [Mortierella sp. AD032]|nr:hypothetical protein BGX24_011748 [Mortierella sp. AD032]